MTALEMIRATNRLNSTVQVAFQVIDQATAQRLIERSKTVNRKLKPNSLAIIAKKMAEGKWVPNGESIVISRNGNILDGHHRLHACAKFGHSFITLVVDGVDDVTVNDGEGIETVLTYDDGVTRSKSDALVMAGSGENAADNSAIARLVVLLDQGKIGTPQVGWADLGFANSDVHNYLIRHPEINASVPTAAAANKKFPAITRTLFGFCLVAFGRHSKEKAAEFVRLVSTGIGLEEGSPVLLLRDRMVANQASKAKLPMVEVLALIIKAWRYFARGESLKYLRFHSATESFPKIDPDA